MRAFSLCLLDNQNGCSEVGFLYCNGLVESPLKTAIRYISPKFLSLCRYLEEGGQTEQTRGWRK